MPRWNNVGPTERRKSNGKRKSVKMWYWLGHGTGCYSNMGDNNNNDHNNNDNDDSITAARVHYDND